MVTTTISTTLIFVISWPQVTISDSGRNWCVELSPQQRSDLGAAHVLLVDDVAEVAHRPRHVPSHQHASVSPTPDSMKFRSACAENPQVSPYHRSYGQRRRGCSTISGNQTRYASPAATAHHLRLVPFPPVRRPSPSRRFPGVIASASPLGGLPGGRTRNRSNLARQAGVIPIYWRSRSYNQPRCPGLVRRFKAGEHWRTPWLPFK
jgi:hypothetical protein